MNTTPQATFPAPHHTKAGFTTVELLTVIVIVSVLAVAAVFASFRLYQNQQIQNATSQFVTDLSLAKTLARKTSNDTIIQTTLNSSTYTLKSTNGTQTKTLPGGTQFTSALTVTFTAPYGLTLNPNQGVQLKRGNKTSYVKWIGLNARVVTE